MSRRQFGTRQSASDLRGGFVRSRGVRKTWTRRMRTTACGPSSIPTAWASTRPGTATTTPEPSREEPRAAPDGCSASGKPTHHYADHCPADHRLGVRGAGLVVPCKTSVGGEAREGAFESPALAGPGSRAGLGLCARCPAHGRGSGRSSRPSGQRSPGPPSFSEHSGGRAGSTAVGGGHRRGPGHWPPRRARPGAGRGCR